MSQTIAYTTESQQTEDHNANVVMDTGVDYGGSNSCFEFAKGLTYISNALDFAQGMKQKKNYGRKGKVSHKLNVMYDWLYVCLCTVCISTDKI